MEKLLTFDGRIRRMGWWIASIAMGIVSSVVENVRDNDDLGGIAIIALAIVAFIIWLIGISLNVRRWHDLNRSGWWILINIIPIVGWIYSIVMLGFVPGDRDHNSYGPPPEEGAIL